MRCLQCNIEMKKGYLQSAREIFWSKNKKKIFFKPDKKNDIVLTRSVSNGAIVKSYYCPICKMIIVKEDYD